MVEPGARVLDVGCGDGALLDLLAHRRSVDGRGIELSREGVSNCVAKGLSVIQGDADTDLADYPDDAFDYVILSQTIQATRNPRRVLEHMLRIGRRAIVSFPNFGHWRIRAQVGLLGRMPVTDNLPFSWYDTPNIHFCTIRDFVALCRDLDAKMETRRRPQCHGPARARQFPLVGVEPLRRAGGVLAAARIAAATAPLKASPSPPAGADRAPWLSAARRGRAYRSVSSRYRNGRAAPARS